MPKSTEDAPDPVETWCVGTEDGCRYVLGYAGNGGFGPANVWTNGLMVPVVRRHRFQRGDTHCLICADPTLATTYLPPIHWESRDSLVNAEPGSGRPDRGMFQAVFRTRSDSTRIWVEVFRRDWWHTWSHYATVRFDPHGDWRGAFSAWRQSTTGYLPNTDSSLANSAGNAR